MIYKKYLFASLLGISSVLGSMVNASDESLEGQAFSRGESRDACWIGYVEEINKKLDASLAVINENIDREIKERESQNAPEQPFVSIIDRNTQSILDMPNEEEVFSIFQKALQESADPQTVFQAVNLLKQRIDRLHDGKAAYALGLLYLNGKFHLAKEHAEKNNQLLRNKSKKKGGGKVDAVDFINIPAFEKDGFSTYFKIAMDYGCVRAIYHAGFLHESGFKNDYYEVRKDPNVAYKNYMTGATLGDASSYFSAGRMLLDNAQDDIEKMKSAIGYIAQAANRLHPYACLMMGNIYRDGLPILEKSPRLGVNYYMQVLQTKNQGVYSQVDVKYLVHNSALLNVEQVDVLLRYIGSAEHLDAMTKENLLKGIWNERSKVPAEENFTEAYILENGTPDRDRPGDERIANANHNKREERSEVGPVIVSSAESTADLQALGLEEQVAAKRLKPSDE